MEHRKKVFIITLLLCVLSGAMADNLVLIPANGMMFSHPLVFSGDTETAYTALINDNTGISSGTFNNLAVAMCSNEARVSSIEKEAIKYTVICDEMSFISDDNPVYKRPFKLYYLQRGHGRGQDYSFNNTQVLAFGEIKSNQLHSFPAKDDGRTYYQVWRDIILQMDGESTSGGVTVDGVFYPLIQGNYTARFEIEATYGNDTQRLTVIIPAYYSGAESIQKESSCALSVTPYANSVNLNLQSMINNPSSFVEVGSIDFMYRFNGFSKTPTLDDGSTKFYLFLSASADPFTSDINGFKLVHQDFVHGEDFYNDSNSLDYVVELRGDSEHPGLNQVFDGTDFMNESGVSNYLNTQCHKTYTPQSGSYTHYHTYGGTLSVRLENVDAVASNPTILFEGRYSSKIYIHIVSREEEDTTSGSGGGT